jgi:cellulose biosynthesis protein BcsE
MLGIFNIAANATELRSGSVYACLGRDIESLTPLLIAVCSRSTNAAFVSLSTADAFFKDLNTESRQSLDTALNEHCQSSFFWDDPFSTSKNDSRTLLRDVKRLPKKSAKTYIIALNASAFSERDPERLSNNLAEWNKWARQNQCSVLFLIDGAGKSLESALLSSNEYLSGLSSMHPVDSKHYRYQIHHWKSESKIIAEREYMISSDTSSSSSSSYADETMPTTDHKHERRQEGENHRGDIYTVKSISKEIESDLDVYKVIANNNAILEHSEFLRGSMVIFSCSKPEELHDLAAATFNLRTKYRQNIKIIIRETTQCLRYADEQLLLRAGINLIIPHLLNSNRLITQIIAIRGQLFENQLPPSLEGLMESWQQTDYNGYTDIPSFVASVKKSIAAQAFSKVEHALVCFEPLKGIGLDQSLSLCQINRDGDMITASRGFIYLFLHACRLKDIDSALKHTLTLPSKDIFSSQSIIHEANDVRAELERIEFGASDISLKKGRELLANSPNTEYKPSRFGGAAIEFAKPVHLAKARS